MEISRSSKPMLKNEFSVSVDNIIKLFKKHKVYVFGYGSLMYPEGWTGRQMAEPPRAFVIADLNNFERGPFGLFGVHNFYGIIRTKGKNLNGVVAQIKSPADYYHLMLSEYVVGLHTFANYRVVDITDEIKIDLPNNAVVHTVVNRPINRVKILTSFPAPGYYNSVIRSIKSYHEEKTIQDFLASGGFESRDEVSRYLERGGDVNIPGRR